MSPRNCPASPARPPEGHLATYLEVVQAQLRVQEGRLEHLQQGIHQLREFIGPDLQGAAGELCITALVPLIRRRAGTCGEAVFDLLEAWARQRPRLTAQLLAVRDPALLRRTLALLVEQLGDRSLPATPELAGRVGTLVEQEPTLQETEVLRPLQILLTGGPAEGSDVEHLEASLATASPWPVRTLAARLLDLQVGQPPPARIERLLGSAAASRLIPLLAYTGASHLDLVTVTPLPDQPPPLLASLDAAEARLGQTLLAELIGRLGWGRVVWGMEVQHRVGLSLSGSLPLMLEPDEAALLEACGPGKRLWERTLVLCQGEGPRHQATEGQAERIQRFRRHNLRHAELLAELLAVAPLTGARARRILAGLDQVVEDFTFLFGSSSADAQRLPSRYRELREPVAAHLAGRGDEELMPAETTRLVLMFEEPGTLEEVRTLHGLKRYLHQQGLTHAFKLFGAAGTANRTVDLVLVSPEGIEQVLQRLRYIDFEAAPGEVDLPVPVAMAAEAYGRQLLLGRHRLPLVEVLVHGNEVQVYVSFRNHPAFLRLDLAPPLRGGMIDLEYCGVSLYELDHHPDLGLRGIRRLFQRLEFATDQDGTRLHLRYDKERAADLGDLLERVATVFRVVPYLMDLDWVVGWLEYPETARELVVDAWIDHLLRWGVLPVELLLCEDRRHVLQALEHDATGLREVPWDGAGGYRDRFLGLPGPGTLTHLRGELARRGLGPWVRWEEERGQGLAQLPLERAVLRPLREARARGEVQAGPRGLEPAPGPAGRREHPAIGLARVLRDRGLELEQAIRRGTLLAALERSLRFRSLGQVQGHAVEGTSLHLRGQRLDVHVLRDAAGCIRLAQTSPGPSMDPVALREALCRDGQLPPGSSAREEVTPESAEALARSLESSGVSGTAASISGECMISGQCASPGRGVGLARLGTGSTLHHGDLEGAILVSQALQPEDAPLLREVNGIVATGGGILSHAGAIALELRRPALVIEGRWEVDSEGRAGLVCRRGEVEEREEQVGPYQVTLLEHLQQRQEVIRDGDLLVVDASAGTLTVLGQDPAALALVRELRQLETAALALELGGQAESFLHLRGRLVRAVHQLEKLLVRLSRPALVNHAVQELLLGETPAATPHRGRLLQVLLRSAQATPTAQRAAEHCRASLALEVEASATRAAEGIAAAGNLYEVLYLRLEARRRHLLLQEVEALLQGSGLGGRPPVPFPDLETLSRERLRHLACHVETRLASTTLPAWLTGHLQRARSRLRELLGEPATPTPGPACPPALLDRLCLGPGDGGLELAPLVGRKAASLGELTRVLGAERVPAHVALTDHAFRSVLALPAPGERGVPLAEGIQLVLSRGDLDAEAQAAAIRRLWEQARLPSLLQEAVVEAYRRLGGGPVAIRSSALEEDTEESAWAGQFETYLFVQGEAAVLDHVRRAWAGLWTERAILQRRALGAGDRLVGGGIIIQRLVEARVAGVLHTACLATGRPGEMVINVGLGLGEGVVSGTVDVDQILVAKDEHLREGPLSFQYTVGDKRERVVLDTRAGTGTRREEALYHQRLRPALEYVELCELVHAAVDLEEALQEPLDIEFAFEGSTLAILQARPVALFHAAWRETLTHAPLEMQP